MLKKFIDIGANLTDPMYQGIYNGSKKHEADLQQVLNRGWEFGLDKLIITGGSLEESKKAIDLAKTDERLFVTVGCHPTRCKEFEDNNQTPENYLRELSNLINENKKKVVALGECGLDYDRLQFCDKDTQKKYFELQLQLNCTHNLPLFLHCRNAANDVFNILSKYNFKGVIHSFDGALDDALRFINLGYHIGINGCSLKTQENLQTVKDIPNDKILIETDAPWCEIRPTHAGYKYISEKNKSFPTMKKEKWKFNHMVKSRNEPVNALQVLDILAAIKNVPINELTEHIFNTTNNLFFS